MTHPAHTQPPDHGAALDPNMHATTLHAAIPKSTRSVLAWPAWLRVLTVLPVLLALWLAVWWANAGVVTW